MAWPTGYIRCILFFRAPEGDGFSEEYLASEADVPTYNTWAQGIITQRVSLLPDTYTLIWARINRPHDAHTLLPYTGTPALPIVGQYSDASDFQRCEVGPLQKFFTASGRVSNRIFRGVLDAAVNTDGTLNLGNSWSDLFTSFCTYLVGTAKVGLINTKATARFAAYTYERYTASESRGTSTRDTGRPFGLRRGRSASTAA